MPIPMLERYGGVSFLGGNTVVTLKLDEPAKHTYLTVSELSEFVGLPRGTIYRLLAEDDPRLLDPDARIEDSPGWDAERASRWGVRLGLLGAHIGTPFKDGKPVYARTGARLPASIEVEPALFRAETTPYLGVNGVLDMLGVTAGTFYMRRREGRFVQPDARMSSKYGWLESTVWTWCRRNGLVTDEGVIIKGRE